MKSLFFAVLLLIIDQTFAGFCATDGGCQQDCNRDGYMRGECRFPECVCSEKWVKGLLPERTLGACVPIGNSCEADCKDVGYQNGKCQGFRCRCAQPDVLSAFAKLATGFLNNGAQQRN
ncbi:unnamed protein product [Bursaphelenchus xylophilus]|uniref:(pine wood nematode) hypothetical protein n=1 Tax=Bursaphelenchus xylophilus TaxID=6326 RepID=A0A7I8X9Z4_BURXY|nr:unnamed protein product [Bursaphelenchus xylophilus]CAG9132216.1 unnamed protein product [Bursaphelenchus xylophilus]